MPEKGFDVLQGFVMVWEAAVPKPLQSLCKKTKSLSGICKNLSKLFKNTKQNAKHFPAPKTSPGSKTFAKVFGAGGDFWAFGVLERF